MQGLFTFCLCFCLLLHFLHYRSYFICFHLCASIKVTWILFSVNVYIWILVPSEQILLLVFKGGARCDPANYRPISLTSVVCKLTEHVLSTHIRGPFWHGICISNMGSIHQSRLKQVRKDTAHSSQMNTVFILLHDWCNIIATTVAARISGRKVQNPKTGLRV